MIRRVALAVSALTGAVALGRKAADASIEKQLAVAIDDAKQEAIETLDREIDGAVGNRLAAFSLTLLVKAALLSLVFLARSGGLIEGAAFKVTALGLLAAYLGHDVTRLAPHAPVAWRVFRDYGFNLQKATTEYVSETAFARAYEEATRRLGERKSRAVIAVSNYSRHELSERVARAVADVARTVSFERIRARVAIGAAKALVLMASYTIFLMLIFSVG